MINYRLYHHVIYLCTCEGPLLDNVTLNEDEYDCITGKKVAKVDYLITYVCSSGFLLLAVINIYFVKPVVHKKEKKQSIRKELSW